MPLGFGAAGVRRALGWRATLSAAASAPPLGGVWVREMTEFREWMDGVRDVREVGGGVDSKRWGVGERAREKGLLMLLGMAVSVCARWTGRCQGGCHPSLQPDLGERECD